MKKLYILLFVFFMLFCNLSFVALATENEKEYANFDLTLPDDTLLSLHGIVFIGDSNINWDEAKSNTDGIIIEFWKNADNLRFGVRKPLVTALQVRTEIPLTNFATNRKLTVKLTRDSLGKWKLTANNINVNNRNWNIVVPSGTTEAQWRTTDDIYYCTDYSKGGNGDGSAAFPDENGKLDFLSTVPAKLYLTFDNRNMPFNVTNIKLIEPTSSSTSKASSSVNSIKNTSLSSSTSITSNQSSSSSSNSISSSSNSTSQNNSDSSNNSNRLLFIVIAILIVVIVLSVLFVLWVYRKNKK